MKTLTIVSFLTASAFGQAVTINPPSITLNCLDASGAVTVVAPCTPPALLSLQSWLLTQFGSPSGVSLTVALTPSATTVTVSDASQIKAANELWIEGEACNIVSKAGNVITVIRADMGTTAAAHAVGASVQVLKYLTTGPNTNTTTVNMIRNLGQQDFLTLLQSILDINPTGPLATQDASVTAARNTKSATKANAAQ